MHHATKSDWNRRDLSNFPVAFFVGGRKVGSVRLMSTHQGFMRGRLELDESFRMRQLFELAAKLAADADGAAPDEFPLKWAMWNQSCRELTELHISIGTDQVVVLDIEVSADWTIDWSFLDDELFED